MKKKAFIVCILLLVLISVLFPHKALSQTDPDPTVPFKEDVQLSFHPETGKINFVTGPGGKPVDPSQGFRFLASPETAARSFLSSYGSHFGLEKPSEELVVIRESKDEMGHTFVRFQQVYEGIPIVGGELIVQVGSANDVLSASGEALPWKPAATQPVITPEEARQAAMDLVAKHYGYEASALKTTEPALWIYNPALLGGPGPRITSLVWRLEVEPLELQPVRELVLVDAVKGHIVLNFNQVDSSLYRQTYTANNSTSLPGTPVCNESDPFCSSGDPHAKAAHTYAGDAYNFYLYYHGRDSIDNAGMILNSTVHYGSNYQNAYWSGLQMVYGDGFGFALADDVIAHELTHGVTQFESNLYYYYQSGAINESLSDVWGEFMDQWNGKGNDAPEVKWLIGEDVTGYGAFRDMRSPTNFGNPNKMTSEYYWCSEEDAGGVHTNSGVNNKAVYLMTDGGSFNGKTITGIGYQKVARIYYKVQTDLLTSGADYLDLYNNVLLACSTLTGSNGITAGDCAQVKNALDAVEMNQQPTSCAANDVSFCPGNKTPTNIFSDNLETPSANNWQIGSILGERIWYYPQNPNPYTDLTYTTSGIYNFFGDNLGTVSDSYIGMKNNVSIPAGKDVYLHFKHAYSFEDNSAGTVYYDGGVVEYSTNNGTSWLDAGQFSDFGGYDGTIAPGLGNPLGGRMAFGGASSGYQSTRIKLNTLADQDVRFRFRIGTDNSLDDYGWFIDDINIYTCPAVILTTKVYLPNIQLNASSWSTFFQESFEGSFPGPWQVFGGSGSGYTYGKRDCEPFTGSNSSWAVGGGSNGSTLPCNSNYPNGVTSWLVYGPFNLQGVDDAILEFMLWQNTEPDRDYFFRGVSNDSANYHGWYTSGNSNNWKPQSLDLSDYTGQAKVWIGFLFSSDSLTNYPGGVFIDDVAIKTCTGICPVYETPTITTTGGLQSEEVTIQYKP